MADANLVAKVQRHKIICEEINDLYDRKNHDYGDSFHQTFVEEGMAMTADMREWRHFIRLRCAPAAHPDMRVVAGLLYDLLKSTYPVFFEDIEVG